MALLTRRFILLALSLSLLAFPGLAEETVGDTSEDLRKQELEEGLKTARKLPKISLEDLVKSFKWGASEEEVKALLAQAGLEFHETQNTNRGTSAFYALAQFPYDDIERPFGKITWVFFPPRGLMYSYVSFAVQPSSKGALEILEKKLIPLYDGWFGAKGVNLMEDPYYKYEWRNGTSFNITMPVKHEGSKSLAVLVSSTYSEAIYTEYQAMFPNPKPESSGTSKVPAPTFEVITPQAPPPE